MSIGSMIVETADNAGDAVLKQLALMPQITVYGMKENQIVAVVEGGSTVAVNETILAIANIDEVLGVYPVSINEHDA